MITTVTLNVAIDKAYVVNDFQKNTVTRVIRCTNTAGGKGLNVSKIIKLCGEDLIATGFIGGHSGAYVKDMLNESQVNNDFIYTSNETRSCINILASDGSSTEFLEPGAPIKSNELSDFFKKSIALAKVSDVVTISGSAPKGVPSTIYSELITMIKQKNAQVILDTSGSLLADGIKAKPTLIKPNTQELENLFNIKITSIYDVITIAKTLHNTGIKYVVVSLGKDGALLVCDKGTFLGKPPIITPVNTVGCGDSMVGAFAVGIKRNYNIEKMLKYAVAVSAANALTMETGNFKMNEMKDLYNNVSIELL